MFGLLIEDFPFQRGRRNAAEASLFLDCARSSVYVGCDKKKKTAKNSWKLKEKKAVKRNILWALRCRFFFRPCQMRCVRTTNPNVNSPWRFWTQTVCRADFAVGKHKCSFEKIWCTNESVSWTVLVIQGLCSHLTLLLILCRTSHLYEKTNAAEFCTSNVCFSSFVLRATIWIFNKAH